MKMSVKLPSRRETTLVLLLSALYLGLTAAFVGLRVEHVLLIVLYNALFFGSEFTRKLAVALLPFAIFGASYDWMRVYPNYEVNPIDVAGVYTLEKSWFGVTDGGLRVTLCEYFAQHHCAIVDFLAGIFYLCWVPVPIAFGVWLYFAKRREVYLRFAIVFLFVNLIGFAGYYIHPAAPPWYVAQYGLEPILNTPGSTAGLGRFDELVGMNIFGSIYTRNSNVFAAIPSLHSAYMLVTLYYAIVNRSDKWVIALFSVILVGIWFTAIYSSHHYLIDVLLGIGCALSGILIFEKGIMKIPAFRRFFGTYLYYIE